MPSVLSCHINEFAVESEIALPCDLSLRPVFDEQATEPAHVCIRRASLADLPCLLRKLRRQLAYDVGDGFLIEPKDDLALHLNLRGDTLRIDCSNEILPVAAAWAFHAGLGAATLLRGGLPLHAAGLEVDGRFIGLTAQSGTGKSTTSWFLLQNGARFANDDLIPCYVGEGGVTAYPSVSLYPKLSREAVDQSGLDRAALLPADYGTGEEEYHVPLSPDKRLTIPKPLDALFLLDPQPDAEEGAVRMERLGASAASDLIAGSLHADWLIGKYLNRQKLRLRCEALAARTPVYTLRYRRTLEILPRLGEAIRRCLDGAAER
jgi:hypothetical protein